MSYNIAVIGGVFGDESKGLVTHRLSPKFDWVARYNGGCQAGHTIYRNGKKYVHNLLPSIDFRISHTKGFIGSGVVIDLEHFAKEIIKAEEDFPNVGKRIYIDPDAFLVLPKHKEEDKLKNGHLGTTNRGIGPAHVDKISRTGFRVKDVILGKETSQKPFYDQLVALGVHFKHILELEDEFKKSNVLMEGAQSVMLDINHGTYPYVSCGDACLSGIYANGFSFIKFDKVYGVAKAYSTRVGLGEFVTEVHGEEAEQLRTLGLEFGATTGRARRIGHLDLPALKYACKKGGIDTLIVAKFDILDGSPTVKVCTEYEKTPVCPADFFDAKPIYEDVQGWNDSHDVSQLKPIIDLIEEKTGYPVEYISCGVEDKDFIKIK